MPSLTTGSAAPRFMLRRKTGVAKLGGLLAFWRSRKALSDLDETLLADVGLSRDDVRHEMHRSPWDVPSNWRI